MGKKIPLWQTIIVFIVLLVLLYWGIMVDTDAGEGHVVLIFACGFASLVAIANGWKWAYLEQGILAAINRTMQAILILAVVGLMLGSWVSGGVVPSMMYYGIKIISPKIFLFTTCLLCSIVSLATGSSWSTAGSMGAALMGVGIALGFSPAMTAGAVVSGSYFGDKMSPMSDTTNLAPGVAGSNIFDHIRHMVYTVTPSYIIALVVFFILGRGAAPNGEIQMEMKDVLQEAIRNEFVVSPLLILPVILLLVAVILKVPAIPAMFFSVIMGLFCMGVVQHISFGDFFSIMHYGYESISADIPLSDDYSVADVVGGGGFDGMLWTVSIVLCSMSFAGVLEVTGMLGQLVEAILKVAKTNGLLVLATICTCIFVNLLTADQYLAIILPGRMYRQAFEDRKLKAKNLSRCLEDSATLTSPLIPWNVCGATMTGFLGQPTAAYAKYAVLNYVNPIVSIIYGFTGFTMEKMTDEEYEKLIEMREAEAEAMKKELEA